MLRKLKVKKAWNTASLLHAVIMFTNIKVDEKYYWPKPLKVMPLLNILFIMKHKIYHQCDFNILSKNKTLFS